MEYSTGPSKLRSSFYTLVAALACIFVGLLVGYVGLLIINAEGATRALATIVGNFLYFPKAVVQIKYLGLTLSKTAPLIMCSLAVIYGWKVGLFNIGVAGQCTAGTCACLYLALACGMPWPVCLLGGAAAGALTGALCGALKSFCNVNEVISGIMINWIALYITNMALTCVKAPDTSYTLTLASTNPSALLPTMGLDLVFGTPYIGLAVFIALIAAVLIWIRFRFTRFGFELMAIGSNKFAARSAGMHEKLLIVAALAIAGGIAGLGGTMLYLSGLEEWTCAQSTVPNMGFNGIASAFLGGLNPIGALFSSFFIQHITDGGNFLDTALYSKETSGFIAGVIIYLCGFMMMIRSFLLKRHEAKTRRGTANGIAGGADKHLDGETGKEPSLQKDKRRTAQQELKGSLLVEEEDVQPAGHKARARSSVPDSAPPSVSSLTQSSVLPTVGSSVSASTHFSVPPTVGSSASSSLTPSVSCSTPPLAPSSESSSPRKATQSSPTLSPSERIRFSPGSDSLITGGAY